MRITEQFRRSSGYMSVRVLAIMPSSGGRSSYATIARTGAMVLGSRVLAIVATPIRGRVERTQTQLDGPCATTRILPLPSGS